MKYSLAFIRNVSISPIIGIIKIISSYSIENIKAGNLTVINSAQFCAELGRQAIIQGYDLLNKKEIPRKVLIPTFPVTKETLDRYTGWKGKIPKPFRKPWLENESWNNQIEKN